MTEDEKQRMIHIRLGSGLHRDLRRAAAEYDVTRQEIVSKAVEERVHAIEAEIRLEEKSLDLEQKARELEQRMQDRLGSPRPPEEPGRRGSAEEAPAREEISVTVSARLDEIELKLERILGEISRMERRIGGADEASEAEE
jgi:tetrahydromethanopterin S-methyltransferase subunit G